MSSDNDLKILSEQLAAAEEEIFSLRGIVHALLQAHAETLQVIDHLSPSRVGGISAKMFQAVESYKREGGA